VVEHGHPSMPKERAPEDRPTACPAAGALPGRSEEGGQGVAFVVPREDAREGAPREEVRVEEAVGVNYGAPRAAYAP
jgi:hypothetical protein